MGRRRAMFAITLITVAAVAGCRGGHATATGANHTTANTSTTTAGAIVTPGAPAAVARQTLGGAVAALLSAEQRGDHAASFALLSDESRARYGTISRWRSRRDEMPTVTGFDVVGHGPVAGSLDVIVDHPAGLDPFRGLSPARDHEIWIGRHERGGWLVDADPAATPVLPSERGVAPAVDAWVKASEACDQPAQRRLQAVDPLLGIGDASRQLCRQSFAFAISAPSKVAPGDLTQQLVAQYGASALGWARVVTLTGAPAPIQVLAAPIGATWQVIGAYT
jgi:hypothetical protein